MSDRVVSQEQYEEALAQWVAARAAMDDANDTARECERVFYAAEEALTEQEAFPGVPAYMHAQVPGHLCRVGPLCRIHGRHEGNV
jgi:hypothetical protein